MIDINDLLTVVARISFAIFVTIMASAVLGCFFAWVKKALSEPK